MARYRVGITRDCTETTFIEVEATSENGARLSAIEQVLSAPENYVFEFDECSGDQSDIYETGVDKLDA